MNNSGMHRIGKAVASVLLGVYVFSAVVAASPPSAFGKFWARAVGSTLNRFGLYSSFALFAPYPEDFNQEFQANIRFADGSTKTWVFPHLALDKNSSKDINVEFFWTEWQIYFMGIPSPAREQLWLDAARYVAWLHRNPANQPVAVTIIRKYRMIIAPRNESDTGGLDAEREDVLYDYSVEQEKLK